MSADDEGNYRKASCSLRKGKTKMTTLSENFQNQVK
jgi:hypothetical protein